MSKILIVDDERVNRKVFAMVLQQAGYEVLEAADGCDALEYFDLHHSDLAKPDLVLLGVIRSHMSRLRRRLPAGLDIVSKRGRGYALIRK